MRGRKSGGERRTHCLAWVEIRDGGRVTRLQHRGRDVAVHPLPPQLARAQCGTGGRHRRRVVVGAKGQGVAMARTGVGAGPGRQDVAAISPGAWVTRHRGRQGEASRTTTSKAIPTIATRTPAVTVSSSDTHKRDPPDRSSRLKGEGRRTQGRKLVVQREVQLGRGVVRVQDRDVVLARLNLQQYAKGEAIQALHTQSPGRQGRGRR